MVVGEPVVATGRMDADFMAPLVLTTRLRGRASREQETGGEETCMVHPLKRQPWWQCRFTDYAADMNIALSYLKLLDNWEDDGSLAAAAAAGVLKPAFGDLTKRPSPKGLRALRQNATKSAAASAFG